MITEELFPGAVNVQTVCDPDDPGVEFASFQVRSDRDFDALIRMELEWHELVVQARLEEEGRYRLVLVPE